MGPSAGRGLPMAKSGPQSEVDGKPYGITEATALQVVLPFMNHVVAHRSYTRTQIRGGRSNVLPVARIGVSKFVRHGVGNGRLPSARPDLDQAAGAGAEP